MGFMIKGWDCRGVPKSLSVKAVLGSKEGVEVKSGVLLVPKIVLILYTILLIAKSAAILIHAALSRYRVRQQGKHSHWNQR